jgi:CRP-like cAMP-binding protein
MVSPELLRRYTFFAGLGDSQLKSIAMLSNEEEYEGGATIFKEGDPANYIYLLIDGSVDLFYTAEEEYHPKTSRQFAVGEINVGEVFGISALIDPYVATAEARVGQDSRILMIDAVALRALFFDDIAIGFHMMSAIARTIRERMAGLRAQLAAAWS